MKPARTRLTRPRFADLVLAPGVERVVDGQRELELAVVAEVEQVEAFGDREQSARLRRRVAIVGDVGAVHDPREQLQRRVVELVLLDEHLERAEPVAVGVLGARARRRSARPRARRPRAPGRPGRRGTRRPGR